MEIILEAIVRICWIDGCPETHNRLLHGSKYTKSDSTYRKIVTVTAPEKDVAGSSTKGEK